jgi:hypothetical protein
MKNQKKCWNLRERRVQMDLNKLLQELKMKTNHRIEKIIQIKDNKDIINYNPRLKRD